MSDQFVGEIRAFACNFAPKNWQVCAGQLLQITQNTALFSVIGSFYGGDGVRTFALPDLEGNVPVCCSSLPNVTSPELGSELSSYALGQFGGEQTHVLATGEMPAHNHLIAGDKHPAAAKNPGGAIYKEGLYTGTPPGAVFAYNSTAPNVTMNRQMLGLSGGGQAHNNMMPYVTLTFCIAMMGYFPPRG